jgi:vacuolar-type H+-ATPase subunit F/Vma7
VARIWYIGDEATAAGYRLAGAEVRVPAPAEVREVFGIARSGDAELILLSARSARELPAAELDDALTGTRPLVAIVPDAYGRHPGPDMARAVRLALGIEP